MKRLNQNLPPDAARATKLKALILDWAGTTVDFGSVAPVKTLDKVFVEVGIQLAESEIRQDMGLPKKDHIRWLLSLPRVSAAWEELHGRPPSPSDVEEMYQRFIPQQLSCLAEYSSLIPGVVESVRLFRERGLKIGSTTGYTRDMLDLLIEHSAKAGYRPDCCLAPEDVGIGRPEPFMIYETAVRLQASPLASIAKVGDTPADIAEGLNAGTWSIGVAGTGNGIGFSFRDFQALSLAAQESRLQNARSELERAGAHYVVDTLAELNAVLDDIDARLKSGGSISQVRTEGA